MAFKYFPHTPEDINGMLSRVGVKTLDDLFADIPEQIRFKGDYDLPTAMSEIEIRRFFDELCRNDRQFVCFAGAGVYDHYTPSLIPYIVERSEFLTSYTPYQAEISQGTLQYIFEYQSLMADLTGMDVSNASMYDGATATAEAMMMAVASAKKRNTVLASAALLPQTINVLRTYALFHGVNLEWIETADGATDTEAIKKRLQQNDVAGVIVPRINYYGVIETLDGLADICHAHKALLIINSPASPLAVLKTPGELGADIACGDAQSLGIPLSFGGPYIGYLCTRTALIRKMPGRLVGGTVDADGKRAFVLTMQAREQHIRREKATSNICTSQGMMCLYVAIYLSLMGPKGLKEVNEASYAGAHYLHDRLMATNLFSQPFNRPFFNEFCLDLKAGTPQQLIEYCADRGYLAGCKAEGRDKGILFCVTESRSKAEADELVRIIESFKA